MLETDSPFLTPHPHRGKRNEPSYLPLIAGKIADIFQLDMDEIMKITTNNAVKFFSITN